MSGPVSVCSAYFSRSSRRPDRAEDAERSKSSEEGGVWTISSSRIVRRSRLSPGAVRTGRRSAAVFFARATVFFATGAVRVFAADGAARRALVPVFRADAVFFLLAVIFRAVFFRADTVFLRAGAAFLRTDAVFLPADIVFFLPADRLRPAFRRVVAAFRGAAFRLAAVRLAMSSSFLRPTGPPCRRPLVQKRVQGYLDSRPISYVKSIAYRRRTVPCRGSGCDPWPPSRVRLPEDGAVPTMQSPSPL